LGEPLRRTLRVLPRVGLSAPAPCCPRPFGASCSGGASATIPLAIAPMLRFARLRRARASRANTARPNPENP
jgi:hypothetical protein